MILCCLPLTGLFFVAIDATINCYREVIWWHMLSDIGGLWGRKGKAFFTSMSSPRFCVLCTTISIEFNKSNQKVYKTMSTYDVLQKNVVGNKTQFWVVFIVGHIDQLPFFIVGHLDQLFLFILGHLDQLILFIVGHFDQLRLLDGSSTVTITCFLWTPWGWGCQLMM